MQLCNMAEIEKEEVEFPGQEGLHKVAASYFLLFMYMVQLYKEDWTILHMLGHSSPQYRADSWWFQHYWYCFNL